MDNKLSKLKENQQLIGSKINMLRETNKKKDEEAEKIRELIAECRENLNRMKNDAMNDKSKGKGASGANRHEISPCLDRDGTSHGGQKSPCGNRGVEDICSKLRQQYSEDRRRHQSVAGSSGGRDDDPCSKYKTNSTLNQRKTSSGDNDPCSKYRQGSPCSKYQSGEMDGPCKSVTDKISTQMSALANAQEISRQCIEQMGEKMEKEMRMRITTVSSCQDGSGRSPCDEISESLQKRVSCKVDLSKMKVNIKGAPEDLKKLDAVQLVNLLDKYHCQELVIKTGSKTAKAPGKEIPIFYILHPGNVVLILGILLVAFLINSNLCDPCRGHNGKLFISMLYVSSLAFHCGTILWMSFIRGFTLRRGLSRETFHSVDNLILPKYFGICVFLSAITLYSFLAGHCQSPCTSWPLPVLLQVIIQSTTFLIELITLCYIVPAIIKLRKATDEYLNEEEQHPPCPIFCKNMEKLAMLNWTMALINTSIILFMGSNVFYVSSKLHLG